MLGHALSTPPFTYGVWDIEKMVLFPASQNTTLTKNIPESYALALVRQIPSPAGECSSSKPLETDETSWPWMAMPSCIGEAAECPLLKWSPAHTFVSSFFVDAALAPLAKTLSVESMLRRETSSFLSKPLAQKLPGTVCAKPCTRTATFAILRCNYLVFVAGNLHAPSMRASWLNTSLDSNIRRRRERRVQSRKQKWTGMRPRRARTFLAPWHSAGPKEQSLGFCIRCFWLPSFVQSHLYFMKQDGDLSNSIVSSLFLTNYVKLRSSCSTHKESGKDAHAAARTAGYLLAVSESGLIFDMLEIIGAESLSQRYHFAAQIAHRLRSLQIIVHDDACHLKAMCQREAQSSSQRRSLWGVVQDHMLTKPAAKQGCVKGFPTEVAEAVNSQFSPLGHCFHHYSPWFAQLVLQACADVHNMSRLQALGDKSRVKERRCAKRALADVRPEQGIWFWNSVTVQKLIIASLRRCTKKPATAVSLSGSLSCSGYWFVPTFQ